MKEDALERIQRYLEKEMPPEEIKAFETELKTNDELAQELALHKEMEDLLTDSPENDLCKNLQLLNSQVKDNKDNPNRLTKYLLWLIPVLLIAGWWFFNPTSTNDQPQVETTTPSPESNFRSAPSKSKIEEENIPEKNQAQEEPENQTPIKTEPSQDVKPKTKNKGKQEPVKKPRPIAANFDTNPSLEFFIGNNVRDNEFEIEVQKKQNNINLQSESEAITFQFNALIKSTTNLQEKNFKLHLFSNDPAAFENFAPLLTNDLTVNPTSDNTYKIDFQKEITLAPGLYYYVLEDLSAEKIHFVEKFEVVVDGRR